MSFTSFLSWLWYQILLVVDWFSDSYYNLKDRLVNFWYYLTREVGKALDTANTWINDAIDGVGRFIDSVSSDIYNYIVGVYNNVVTWVTNWITTAVENISNWIDSAINTVYQWVDDRIADIATGIDNVSGWFTDVIEGFRAWVTDLFSPMLPLVSILDKLVIIGDDNIFSKLIDFLDVRYEDFLDFIDNPSDYLLSRIWDKTIDFIGDVIGYSLGTQDSELPDRKKWINK